MRRFNIIEPRSIDDACEILAEDEDAKLIGGGTALIAWAPGIGRSAPHCRHLVCRPANSSGTR